MNAFTATSLWSSGVEADTWRLDGISPTSSSRTEVPALSGDSRKGEREERSSLSWAMPS